MPGGVGLQHVQPDGVAAVALPRRGVPYVVAQAGVRERGAHRVAAEDQPYVTAPGDVDAVDRALLAQCGVDGVRVGGEVGARGGEFIEGRGRHGVPLVLGGTFWWVAVRGGGGAGRGSTVGAAVEPSVDRDAFPVRIGASQTGDGRSARGAALSACTSRAARGRPARRPVPPRSMRWSL